MENTQALQRTLGERLVKIRRMHGNLRQEEAAERLGIGTRTLVRYEKDERLPPLELLLRYRDEFDVSISWIIDGDDADTGAATHRYPHDLAAVYPLYPQRTLFDIAPEMAGDLLDDVA